MIAFWLTVGFALGILASRLKEWMWPDTGIKWKYFGSVGCHSVHGIGLTLRRLEEQFPQELRGKFLQIETRTTNYLPITASGTAEDIDRAMRVFVNTGLLDNLSIKVMQGGNSDDTLLLTEFTRKD